MKEAKITPQQALDNLMEELDGFFRLGGSARCIMHGMIVEHFKPLMEELSRYREGKILPPQPPPSQQPQPPTPTLTLTPPPQSAAADATSL